MTAVTVWGVATAPHEPAAHHNRWGLTAAHMYRRFNPELPKDGVDLDVDHSVRVGVLIHAEVAPDERVHCVSVIDDGARILEADRPVYYSATLDLRGCHGGDVYIADEARILSLALTFTPASLAARPLQMRAGDIRRATDRSAWPRWQDTLLLRRSVDELPRLRAEQHRAVRVVVPPRVEYLETGDRVIDGELLPRAAAVGELFTRPCTVLSVG